MQSKWQTQQLVFPRCSKGPAHGCLKWTGAAIMSTSELHIYFSSKCSKATFQLLRYGLSKQLTYANRFELQQVEKGCLVGFMMFPQPKNLQTTSCFWVLVRLELGSGFGGNTLQYGHLDPWKKARNNQHRLNQANNKQNITIQTTKPTKQQPRNK